MFDVCGGLQLLNVSLRPHVLQDIQTPMSESFLHRDAVTYDLIYDRVAIVPGSQLSHLCPGVERVHVNSLHHQAIKHLSPEFEAEAFSVTDGFVEAIRRKDRRKSSRATLQWQPESTWPGPTPPTTARLWETFWQRSLPPRPAGHQQQADGWK